MKKNLIKGLCSSLLLTCSFSAHSQGLEGVLVEEYTTITQADADYYNGIGDGSYTLAAGMKTYRVFIDLAAGYRLNTVYGTAANPLDFATTTTFFNDDNWGGGTPPETRRLAGPAGGAAFDTWITVSRASRASGGSGCGGILEQLGVPRAVDPNGNLTLCTQWSGFATSDGHVAGSITGFTPIGVDPDNEPALTAAGNSFTTTGAWALLPAADGPDLNGANRVLIGQFTTAGNLSFHINVSVVPAAGGAVEFYTHDVSESGSTVQGYLSYPAANDCLGTPGGSALPGTPCDDGNVCTVGDLWDGGCNCIPGAFQDADLDGTCDANDGCPNDPLKTAPSACGCGVADVATTWYADTDNDGFGDPGNSVPGFTCVQPPGHVANSTDLCPNDPLKTAPGACGCGVADVATTWYADTDNDGFGDPGNSVPGFTCVQPPGHVANSTDLCPNNPLKTAPGVCGCGVADVATTWYADTDNDGFGDPGNSVPGFTCLQPPGHVASSTDLCPNDPLKIAPGTCGCGNPEPGTVCNDGDPNTSNDLIQANCTCAGTPVGANDCLGVPGGPAQPGTPCDDGNPNTGNDTWTAGCACVGQAIDCNGVPGGSAFVDNCTTCVGGNTGLTACIADCNGDFGGTAFMDACSTCVGGNTGLTPCPLTCTTNLFFVYSVGNNFAQVAWAIHDATNHSVVQSGGVFSNGNGSVPTCLPNGCFYLRVTDSGNDGIAGGYVLTTEDGKRIIDNTNNFKSGGLSAISGNGEFCLPLGDDRPIFTSCDKFWWKTGEYLVTTENTAVSALWVPGGANAVQPANTGYEYWWYNPNGNYSFRKFRPHNVSDGYGNVGATRACHVRLNNWAAANQLPGNRWLNVKVRGVVNGVAQNWGTACRFKLDEALAACPPTKLLDTPGDPDLSCGAIRSLLRGQRIYANPVRGATHYQWRFRVPAEEPTIQPVTAVTTNYILNLNTVPGLDNGRTYDVEVRASLDGTVTWCGTGNQNPAILSPTWGTVCLLTIIQPAIGDQEQSVLNSGLNTGLRLWPNPNRGDQLRLSIEALDAGVETVTMDLYDLSGKRVAARTIAAQDGYVNATIDLDNVVAAGMYMVQVTAGDRVYTERLVVQP